MLQSQTTDGNIEVSGGTLNVEVLLVPAYTSSAVNITPTAVTVSIPLVPGDQTTTTPEQVVGFLPYFKNLGLVARLTIWSNYDPTTNTLTLCSNDLVDSNSTCLSTYPQGVQGQTCTQHTYGDSAPCGTNPNWNYCTSVTPGLWGVLLDTVRVANQTIINAAVAQGFTVVVRTPPPAVDPELASQLRLVYHKGVLKEAFDPEKEYGPDFSIYGIESTWYGEIYLTATDYFANVKGSSNDPRIAGLSWITLWTNQFGPALFCSSFNFNGYPCGTDPGNLVGGHVILGTVAQAVLPGSNNVFIMPICRSHNGNNSVYMAPEVYKKGCAIHNYLP